MNKTIFFALAGVALLATASFFVFHKSGSTQIQTDDQLQAQWTAFKSKYNKKYADPDFEQYRIQVFADNLKFASSDKTMGVTQFMDMTREEFKQNFLTLKTKKTTTSNVAFKAESGDIDWVAKGAVTPIKDQGQCGSCWAFSTTGAVEGALFLSTKKLVSVSEQYLVDCSKDGNEGCNGGLMDTAFTFIESHGIPTEESYPYKAVDQKCKQASGDFKISNFVDVKQGDCNDLLAKLAIAPVAIAVDANNFQFYSGGVFNNCGTQLDHGVLLVGYTASDKSWTVKNSWGASWGEKGFIRLAGGNTCGLCNAASYPIA